MKTEILTKDGLNIYDELIKNYIKDSDIAASTSPDLINSCDGILQINNAYGNTEQDTTRGKNLLDCSGLTTQTSNGGTITPIYDDKGLLEYINVNGTFTAWTYFDTPLSELGQGSYIANGYCSTTPISGVSMQFFKNSTSNQIGNDTGSGLSFTLEENNNVFARIVINSGVTANNLKFYPMIRLASITDGTYEPFTNGASPNPEYPQEIKSVVLSKIKTCGKNLFDRNNPTLNAVLNYGIITENSAGKLYAIPVKIGKQYTISKSILTTESCYVGFCSIPKIGTELTNRGNLANLEKNTVTANDNYLCLVFASDATIADDVQVEEGTTATPYEPHTESVAILSNPITMNGFNGVWDTLESKKFKTVVFDGSDDEGWTAVITKVDGKYRNSTNLLKGIAKPFDIADVANLLCTHYKAIPSSTAGTWGANQGMCIDGTATLMVYDDTYNTSDISLWKAHLASNPMEVTYELAEPTETPLPDADVKALKSLKTYDGVTHIFVESGEVEPALEVEYATSNVGVYLLELYNKSSSSSSGGDAEIKLSESTTYEPLE